VTTPLPPPRHLEQSAVTDKPGATKRGKQWSIRTGNLVWPGLGHLMAGRIVAGLVFIAMATSGLVIIPLAILQWGMARAGILTAALNGNIPGQDSPPLPLGMLALGSAMIALAYAWSWLDSGRVSKSGEPPQDKT